MQRRISITFAVLLLAGPGFAEEAKPAAPVGPNLSPKEVTPATKRSIDSGLAFLARRQSKDGSWTDSAYRRHVGITAIARAAMTCPYRPPPNSRTRKAVTSTASDSKSAGTTRSASRESPSKKRTAAKTAMERGGWST